MKNVLKITIITIIAFLCITTYNYTNAENEETTTETETPVQTETNNEETEANQNEENKPSDSNENNSPEKNNDNEKEPPASTDGETKEDYDSKSNNQQGSQPQKASNAQGNRPAQTRKSNNANLSDMGINPNDFKGFKPGTYTYNVTVPNDVESVNVYAKTQDTKAKITSGTGKHTLDIGNNDINVIVTAEDGSTQTYTINVTREEKAEDKVEDSTTTQLEQKEHDLKKLEIKGYKLSPNFSGDIYEYKLDVNSDVNELEVITEGLNDKVNIEVVGNTELKERRKYYYNIS